MSPWATYFSNNDLSSRFFPSPSCPRNAQRTRRLPEWIPCKTLDKTNNPLLLRKSLTKDSSPTDFQIVQKKQNLHSNIVKRIFITSLGKERKYHCFIESISMEIIFDGQTNQRIEKRRNPYLMESSGGQRTSGPSYGGLKGPDAWKRTSRSWPLTQSRITTRVTVAIVIVGVHRRTEERARGKEKNDENDGGQKDRHRRLLSSVPSGEAGPYVISSSRDRLAASAQSSMWKPLLILDPVYVHLCEEDA